MCMSDGCQLRVNSGFDSLDQNTAIIAATKRLAIRYACCAASVQLSIVKCLLLLLLLDHRNIVSIVSFLFLRLIFRDTASTV